MRKDGSGLRRSLDEIERGILSSDTGPGENPRQDGTTPTSYLDGLRGLAALMVYVSHHLVYFYGGDHPIHYGFGFRGARVFATLPFIRIFFTGGSAGVAIFFVLSGFVLSKAGLDRLYRDDGQSLRRKLVSAAVRRPVRLYLPPICISLAFCIVMHLPFGLAPRLAWPEPKSTLVIELQYWLFEMVLALNPFTSHGIYTRWFPYDPPVWTMPIELTGSALVFALVALCGFAKRRYRLPFLVFLSCGLLCLYQWSMACFVAGMAISLSTMDGPATSVDGPRQPRMPRQLINHGIFIAGWYLLCQVGAKPSPDYSIETLGWHWLTLMVPPRYYSGEYWWFWESIGATLLVYGVSRISWLQKLFAASVLRSLGRVSFSLYLTHIPFLWTVGDIIYRALGTVQPHTKFQTVVDNRLAIIDIGPSGLSTRWILSQLLILPLNLLLAEACTTWIDKPSVRLSKYAGARWAGA